MITAAFGSHSLVERALLRDCAQQAGFQYGLTKLLRPEATIIPLDTNVGMFICLMNALGPKARGKPASCINSGMKEDACREAESIMERDCSTLNPDIRRELRVWSRKVLDFCSRVCADKDSQASC